nr:glycosyltransferase [Helicobacter sp. 12S02232-10]
MQKLYETIAPFSYCELEFIHTKGRFEKLWKTIPSKHHFSKEMLYKLFAASFFPQYDKIIISDVDVVFLDDVSESFLAFDTNEKSYLAGIRANEPDAIYPLTDWKEGYKKFSQTEFESIQNGIGAGYFIANLKQIRKDNIEQKFLDYLIKNTHKLVLAEQDILNIICYPHIKTLSLRHMICHSMWKQYGEKWENLHPNFYTQDQITQARLHPIQLHYAGNKKPWQYPNAPKSALWYYYVCQTPFAQDFLNELPNAIISLYKQERFFNKLILYICNNPLFIFKPRFYVKLVLFFIRPLRRISKFLS